MKMQELKDMADAELAQKLGEVRQELFDLRIQKSTGQLDRPLRVRGLRRDIARIMTLMKQRGKN